MARTAVSQSVHDAEVSRLFRLFNSSGEWTGLRADLAGQPQPPSVGGYIPDVSGYFKKVLWHVEVETAETYSIDHSVLQFKAFSASARLGISVPKGCKTDLDSILRRNNIVATIWEY